MKKLYTLVLALLLVQIVQAQETFPVNDVKDQRSGTYAFINATIYVDYQTKVENATLLIKDGKVVNSGANITIPRGYTTVDLKGKYIYPSMIDMYTNYGLPKVERRRGGFGGPEQIQSKTKGAYNGNEAIKPEYNAYEQFEPNDKTAGGLRKAGFGTVMTFRPDGIARGTSAVVTLAKGTPNSVMLKSAAAAHYSFSKGTSRQNYPSSAMGFVSLLRQTYMDAQWYGSLRDKPFTDKSLDAWISNQSLPQVFDTRGWRAFVRADKVGDEFGVQYIIRGNGDEYKRVSLIKGTNARVILPIAFPEAFNVDDAIETSRLSLQDLKHWELAPINPGVLEANGVDFAITSEGLKKTSDFWPNLRKAVSNGLSKETALKALTSTPANYLNMGGILGDLRGGKVANFIITSGDLFERGTTIYENWIQGQKFIINDINVTDHSGNYMLAIGSNEYPLEVSGKAGKHKMKFKVNDSTDVTVTAKLDGELINMTYKMKGQKGETRLAGWLKTKTGADRGWKGRGQLPNGDWINWEASFASVLEAKDTKGSGGKVREADEEKGRVIFPFVAYGSENVPQQETLLIKNATVWTNEADGILQNTDVLIENGKISKIGKNLSARGAREIDGTGKHLTAGIIDEHSHIAADGINDVATNSGMVRIGDVVNPEHIGIYRALGGGVTAAQILHGSANPIGGQSALIKLRWGLGPEEMKIRNADGFIKFALGENVKRSRSNNSVRYPQTRMGVEQVYVDAFSAARDYEKEWNAYNKLSARDKANATKPRQDLAMDAMVEILNSRRYITCHSYVQSEINMLMKVADRFGFKVNTFTHILEGYKVADKMAAHGVGGSTFSDWWSYKWEVRYAIPYGPALMHNEGVVVALNSDSGELIRRLNQEAAKAVKYGDISEEDALKMVTLNPAKLLHLDDRMGSVKVGKDGDVVLWTDHPLSIYAKAEKTIVDGTVYYDLQRDLELREQIKTEKARIIAKMKGAAKPGGGGRKPFGRDVLEMECETLVDAEFWNH